MDCTPLPDSGYSTYDLLGYCVPKDINEFSTIAKTQYEKLMANQRVSQTFKDL